MNSLFYQNHILFSNLLNFSLFLLFVYCQKHEEDQNCPTNWEDYENSCYRFVKSPLRNRMEASSECRKSNAHLVSIQSMEEHTYLSMWLNEHDPQHRIWYVGVRKQGPNLWINDEDNSQLIQMDAAFLTSGNDDYQGNVLAYEYSENQHRWGFIPTSGESPSCYICEISKRNLNLIILNDRTFEYGLKILNVDRIPRGPYFIQQPQSKVFDLATRSSINFVTMNCVAGGFPSPAYKWFKEEYRDDQLQFIEINSLKSSKFTISGGNLIIHDPHQITDRGKYHCQASNKFGTIVSESTQLSFDYIGEFNLKRSPESGFQNWGKAIYCDPPQAYPSIQYYWSRDSFPNLVDEDKRTFVSNDGNLYFSFLENLDQGYYSCNVKSTVSSTGKNGPFFYLQVVPHANFQQLKFPNNFPKVFPETPIAGQDVKLECIAFGYPVPSYNWTRSGGKNIPSKASFANYNRILILPKISILDGGEYTCTAYNNKLFIKNSLFINVQAKPYFTMPLENMHLDVGEDLAWTCEAYGIPEVKFYWLKNGKKLVIEELPPDHQPRYQIDNNVLIIHKLNPEFDAGMYQCQATNQLGSSFSSAQLRIIALHPSFEKYPLKKKMFAALDGNITIACKPEAAPTPRFRWEKNTQPLSSGGHYTILPNGYLVINPVYFDDQGTYTCIVENYLGKAESSGYLIVLRGPQITEPPQPFSFAVINSSVQLDCFGIADEGLEKVYIWYHNNLRINLKTDFHYSKGRNEGSLIINNITFDHAGEYMCSLKSHVGRAFAKAIVEVLGPPSPPGGIEAFDITETSAIITWSDSASNGAIITVYKVEGRTTWNQTWHLLIENGTAVRSSQNRKEMKLENILSPWSSYEFRIAAANELGFGQFSSPSPFYNTKPDSPYQSPTNVGGGGGKTGDLTITWDPLPVQSQNGPGIWYKIFWKRKQIDPEHEWNNMELKKFGNIGLHVIDVDPLKYFFCEYEVKVQAYNSMGSGPISEPSIVYSAEAMPLVTPSQVSTYPFNSTSLNVTWKSVKENRESIRGHLIGFRIKYWRSIDNETDALYLLSRSKRSWSLIVGLQPNTEYYVKVMAFNEAGPGAESERFLERTFRKSPQSPPVGVKVHKVNPTSVRVTWSYAALPSDEEPLLGFKVMIWEADQDFSTATEITKLLGEILEAYVYDLTPGKIYLLRVMAYSQGGYGQMSAPVNKFQMGDPEKLRSSSSSCALPALLIALNIILMKIFCSSTKLNM